MAREASKTIADMLLDCKANTAQLEVAFHNLASMLHSSTQEVPEEIIDKRHQQLDETVKLQSLILHRLTQGIDNLSNLLDSTNGVPPKPKDFTYIAGDEKDNGLHILLLASQQRQVSDTEIGEHLLHRFYSIRHDLDKTHTETFKLRDEVQEVFGTMAKKLEESRTEFEEVLYNKLKKNLGKVLIEHQNIAFLGETAESFPKIRNQLKQFHSNCDGTWNFLAKSRTEDAKLLTQKEWMLFIESISISGPDSPFTPAIGLPIQQLPETLLKTMAEMYNSFHTKHRELVIAHADTFWNSFGDLTSHYEEKACKIRREALLTSMNFLKISHSLLHLKIPRVISRIETFLRHATPLSKDPQAPWDVVVRAVADKVRENSTPNIKDSHENEEDEDNDYNQWLEERSRTRRCPSPKSIRK